MQQGVKSPTLHCCFIYFFYFILIKGTNKAVKNDVCCWSRYFFIFFTYPRRDKSSLPIPAGRFHLQKCQLSLSLFSRLLCSKQFRLLRSYNWNVFLPLIAVKQKHKGLPVTADWMLMRQHFQRFRKKKGFVMVLVWLKVCAVWNALKSSSQWRGLRWDSHSDDTRHIN